jgi:hypothetical protein
MYTTTFTAWRGKVYNGLIQLFDQGRVREGRSNVWTLKLEDGLEKAKGK